jgi:L-threonylcarbamoyladenylate synthase
VEVASAVEGEAHPSPGMHRRHYSPARTRLVLAGVDLPPGRGVYCWHSRLRPATHAVQMPRDARDYARRLYRTLHDLDREGWDWIAMEPPPDTAEWTAVRDRLSRAVSE